MLSFNMIIIPTVVDLIRVLVEDVLLVVLLEVLHAVVLDLEGEMVQLVVLMPQIVDVAQIEDEEDGEVEGVELASVAENLITGPEIVQEESMKAEKMRKVKWKKQKLLTLRYDYMMVMITNQLWFVTMMKRTIKMKMEKL